LRWRLVPSYFVKNPKNLFYSSNLPIKEAQNNKQNLKIRKIYFVGKKGSKKFVFYSEHPVF
jgi:hypothetical protein